MTKIIKIVLTGGPCAGKTTALSYISDKLEKQGIRVLALQEVATRLMSSGKTPEALGNYEFHSLLFATQLKNEKELTEKAKLFNAEKAVILCDRGLLDNRAFVTNEEFKSYSSKHGLNEDIIRNSYDAVFHLVTAANGAEEHYNFDNEVRLESVEQARAIDTEILSVWTGAPHLRVIDNSTDFESKLQKLLSEVLAVLGIPEPLEIERKFLIEMPDLNVLESIKTCRKVPITQAYLTTPEEGQFRIRRRGEGEGAVYIKTIKLKINDLKRIEIENYISEKEYYDYLLRKEYVRGIISKDRFCIVDNAVYYELDVYPFWNDKATLEIELLNENQEYKLPGFVKLIREVSHEKEFRNKALAVKFGKARK